MHYNEAIQVCAQNENPFVDNKVYNPDHVLVWLITHVLEGFAPANAQEADYLKQLYIASIQFLLENKMPVTEESIVNMRNEIVAYLETGDCTASEEVTTPSEDEDITSVLTKAGITATGDAYRFDGLGKSLTVKKQYVHIAVALLVILLLIKIFK